MELIYDILAIIFYILFFSWIFFKIRNLNLIKKLNYKEIYKRIKKEIKQQKISKKLFKTIIINLIILGLYIGIAIELAIILLVCFMIFPILFVIPEEFYTFTFNYLSLLKYIGYYVYIIIFLVLIRAIYINIQVYKKIKSNNKK